MADVIAALVCVAIALWGGHQTITSMRCNSAGSKRD